MKIEIDRFVLQSLIRSAAPAVASRATIPALKSYHLKADPAGLFALSATDGAIHSLASSADVKVMRGGMCLVDAMTLNDAVKLAPQGDILIASDDKSTLIKYKGGSYKVPVHELNQFPTVTDPQTQPVEFRAPAGDLIRLFDRVSFATTKKEASSDRYATTGIQLEASGHELAAVATDTVRMACATTRLDAPAEKCEGLIPIPVVLALKGAFPEPDEDVTVTLWKTVVKVSSGRATTQGPLLSGQFPKWRVFLTKTSKTTVLSDRPASLLAAVRRASVTADDANAAMDVRAEGAMISLSLSGQAGVCDVDHECPTHEGDTATHATRLFPDHLREWLELAVAAGVEQVQFCPGDGKRAAWLSAGDQWQYMTMPMVKS